MMIRMLALSLPLSYVLFSGRILYLEGNMALGI